MYLEQRPSNWLLNILLEVCQLGDLPTNWDSYGARPIGLETAAIAVDLLQNVLTKNSPVPSVVPTSRGGIQLEWHEKGVDLEVDIRSPTEIQLYYETQGNEVIEENASFDDIRKHVDLLQG